MYTCPQCSLQIDDGFAPLPTKCPQCGLATSGGAAPPPPSGKFDAGDDKTRTIFGMPPAMGAPPPPPRPKAGPPPAPARKPGAPPPPPMGAGGMDLPAPAGDRNRPAELDLPAPAGFDMPAAELPLDDDGGDDLSLDLPAPVSAGDSTAFGHQGFGEPRGDLDLPAPAAQNDFDLPAPAGRNDFDLPAPAGAGFGDLDLPPPPSGLDDLDLPAPAEDLPAPAADLPTPAADLAPADFGGLQLDIDRVGGEAPVPEARPGFGGEYASTAASAAPEQVDAVDTGVQKVAGDSDVEANLVDAVEGEATPATPKSAALPAAGRKLDADQIINHRASPAPKQLPVFTKKRLMIAGGALVLVVGGLAGAFAMGLFDPEAPPTVTRGAGTKAPAQPSGPAAERAEAILARFDEDTPQAYQQAQSLMESQGDRVGQAEAELLLHYRYGPDPVLLGKARGLLEGYEGETASFVTRVFGLSMLAGKQYDAAAQKLAGDDPRAALYRAWLALERDDPRAALEAAEAALAKRPKSMGAMLAKARVQASLDPKGVEALAKAYEANPDHPKVAYTYAKVLLDQGRLAEAHEVASTFEGAPSPVPSFQASTLQLRSQIAWAQGKSAIAMRLLEQAKEINPQDLRATLLNIELLLAQGDISSARSASDILARDNPNLPEAQRLTVKTAIALGEGDLALQRLDAMGEAGAKDPEALQLRGAVHAMRMQVEEARAQFAKVRELDPLRAQSTAAEARLLAKANKPELALEAINTHLKAIDATADNSARAVAARGELLRARAELKLEQGEAEAAKADLQAALEHNPRDNDAQLALARAQLALGQRAEAEKTFLALAERTESYPGLTGPLGRIYLRRGELEQLEKLIGDRLSDERASDEVTLTGALLRLGQDRPDDAMKLVDRVLLRNPASWEGHLARGQILFARGEHGAALIEFEQARPTTPNSDVEFWLGRALEMTGDERKARQRFRRAVELEPGNVLAAAHLGRRLAFDGQSREAIKMLEPLVAETEEYPFAFAVLGRAYYDAGNRKQALVHLRKARRLDPKSFEAAYWEGRIEGDANNHAAAARALAAAVEVAPDSGMEVQDAWRRLARAYKSSGKKAQAREAYKRYLEIAPADAPGRAEAERAMRDL